MTNNLSYDELTNKVRFLESQFENSEKKFKQAFKYSGVGMALVSPTGDFIEVNKMLCKIFGYTIEELKSKSFIDLSHPEEKQSFLDKHHELMNGNCDSFEIDKRFISKNGNIIWGQINVSIVKNEFNSPLFSIVQVQDVTERKLTRQALKENEKYSKILAEISKELIKPELSIKKIADLTYKYALKLTKSKFGYVSSIEKETGNNIGHTLRGMISDMCNIEDKRISFPKSKNGYSGLCGHSLNTHESFYTNTPPNHKASKGLPEGHVPLVTFLSVPVVIKGKLLGQIALANKEDGYDDKDLGIIEELANIYGLAIYRKNVEEELLIAKEKAEEKEAIVRKNNKRLEVLLELNQMRNENIKHIYNSALEKAIELSESKIGFIGILNDDETVVQISSWSSSAMKKCEVKEAYSEFEVEKGGMWSEAIKKRQPYILEDYNAVNQLKKGLPEGHVEIRNYLSIPVFDSGKIVAIIAVANKEEGYSKTDVNELTLLMDGMWNIVKQTKFEKELNNTKEKVTTSENRLQRLVDNMNAGVAVCRPIKNGQDFEFLEFNKSAERIAVEKKQNVIGFTLLQKFPKLEKSHLFKALQHVFINEQDIKLPPFYYKDEKRQGWIENYIYKLPTGEIVDIFVDVTKREEYQQALIESEEKFRTIYEMAEDMICVGDLFNFSLIDINPSFSTKLDYFKEEILNRPIVEFIHPDDIQKTIDVIKDELQKGTVVINFVNRIRCKNGQYRWFDWSAHPIIEKGVAYAIAHDITDIKKYQNELEKHKSNLEELVNERTVQLEKALEDLKAAELQLIQSEKMASLGVLTAGVAHEINNPLNYIQSGIYGLRNLINSKCEQEVFDEKITEIIRIMQEGVKKAGTIVRNLNTFSRKETEEKKKCDIHRIIENCILILNYELIDKCKVIKKFTPEKLVIKGHEENLHQVFIHLIMNSAQAIETTGEIVIKTSVDKQNGLLEIIISDDGEGISEENLNKIFDPFFTTKSPGKGSGLGLSIVYNIIVEHDGVIKYNSEISKGTDVIVNFPMS